MRSLIFICVISMLGCVWPHAHETEVDLGSIPVEDTWAFDYFDLSSSVTCAVNHDHARWALKYCPDNPEDSWCPDE